MKILFLCNKLPYAEVIGGQRIIYNRIRYLKNRGHQVGLLTFIREETPAQIASLSPTLTALHTIPFPRRNGLVRLFHDYLIWTRPAVFFKSFSKEMLKKVGEVVEKEKYNIVIAEFSEMGQYLHKNPYLPAVHKIISCHRCVVESYEKYKELAEIRWVLYLKGLIQVKGLEKYEFEMYRSADRTVVLTPADRFTMQYYAPDLAISVAPSGVDISYLQSQPRVSKKPIILMTGFMGDPANEDGVKWFYKHVWLKLRKHHPEVKFFIVGASPSSRIIKLVKKDPQIIVTGEVDDLRKYRAEARVFISPVRLGSGVRLKVMEAMAGGIPVVSTSLGVAGIDAQNGVNCLIADTPDLFYQSVEWLLTDHALSSRMSRSARELIEEKYNIDRGLAHFELIINSVVEG